MSQIDPAPTELPPTQPIDITLLVERISREATLERSGATQSAPVERLNDRGGVGKEA